MLLVSISKLLCLAMLATACGTWDEGPARWSYIHSAIVEPSCTTAGCHSALTAIAGISLADRENSYAVLTGRICGEPPLPETANRNYVTPGASEYSTLIYQLRGEDRDVMPPDTPLPDVEIDLVARWIDEGAECD
jgi:hypothetical protein